MEDLAMPTGQYPRKIKPLFERLLAKAFPEPNSGCWLFTCYLNENGYGEISISTSKSRLAHRVSYELHKGPIDVGGYVMHKCNNPCCINPDHLEVGTQADNMAHCVRTGRIARAERMPQTKINQDIADAICASHKSNTDLAQQYSISQALVHGIRRNKLWNRASR